MKKTVTPLRSLCAALAALVLLLALAVPAFAAENGFADLYYRLNDSAEVLTEDEDSELEASLEELSVRQSFDVTIATIDSLESEGYTSMEEYADDLYDYCQFGYGADRDGVLLLVSTGDRKWHISTCGYGITAFTDAGIQYLGEQMTPDMADGDYAAAFRTFIQWTDSYVTAAREGQPYDVDNMPKEPFSIVYLGAGHWSGDGADRDRRDEGPAQERGTAAGRNRLCAAGQHEADQPAGSVPVPGRAPHRAAKGDQLRRFRRQFHPHLLQRLDPWRRWRFILKKYRGLL